MANTFKNYTSNSVTTETVVLTGAVATQTTLIGMTIASTSASAETTVSVKLNTSFIVKDATVINGSALVPVGGEQKIVVMAGDTVSVIADATVDVVTSVLEIS
jgi:hypothetical protein